MTIHNLQCRDPSTYAPCMIIVFHSGRSWVFFSAPWSFWDSQITLGMSTCVFFCWISDPLPNTAQPWLLKLSPRFSSHNVTTHMHHMYIEINPMKSPSVPTTSPSWTVDPSWGLSEIEAAREAAAVQTAQPSPWFDDYETWRNNWAPK